MTSNTVKEWLTSYVAMRERKEKNRWLGALILKRHDIELTPLLKSKMDDIVSDILSADRMWRDLLKEHPELQGTDYNDGAKLDQEWQLTHGYTPHYQQDVKELNKIT